MTPLARLLACLALLAPALPAAAPIDFRPDYLRLSSRDWVKDKNFYVLTLLEQLPAAASELASDPPLAALLKAKLAAANSTDATAGVTTLLLSDAEIATVRQALLAHYPMSPALQALVRDHLRPSGCYLRSSGLSDPELLAEAWVEAARGLDHAIRQFAFNLGTHYPEVDGPSYDPADPGYQARVLALVHASARPPAGRPPLVFDPSLALALRLMGLNGRDEPARFEPLAQTENKAAMEASRHIAWSRYPYAAILIHGIGPDVPGQAIAPEGIANCAQAAKLYHQGLAPFLLPSGGFVHPKQTPFCEALEMKRELMAAYQVPEAAILIDPQARHTTTNVRNAVRLLFAIGAPADKPSVSVSLKQHIDSIVSPGFAKRCLAELGYVPATYGRRLNDVAAAFLPSADCLQIDPGDPLDP